jgi:DNA-directed RNA polymerase subunit RPC12/RpoP
VSQEARQTPRTVKCLYCEQPLICAHCGRPFVLRDQAAHDSFYQSESVVRCPCCHGVLRCRSCGIAYTGGEGEYDE